MSRPSKETLRILLADDHPMFREGLLSALRHHEEFEVVGEAGGGREAVELAESLQPDVILMDVGMPEMNGITATRTIVNAHPHIHVLILTMFDDDASVFSAMKAGALGYLLKGSDKEDILRAIVAAGNGEAIFSPSIARKMMYYFKTITRKPHVADLFPKLTEREQEVLELIADGLSNEEIARKLDITIKTVRNNVSNLLNKLQVTDRAQAILLAKEAGLGHSEG
ncbi:response regulator [Cohnella candidum]|uniref:DNA-binding response regulator n=1 Tax=Cohnella candidum TaxID=2674991 RepID=A0A3G3JZ87_9BACL|nr:response regulator transcription factor [Cohnella candidum]AYQ73503.1 DNA-binding response regulator [Cohnella candidum]